MSTNDELVAIVARRMHDADCGCSGPPDPWYVSLASTAVTIAEPVLRSQIGDEIAAQGAKPFGAWSYDHGIDRGARIARGET